MKYTFLIPAYKRKFLKEALGSVLSQSFQDFNVIVSDDCSPEELKSIVDSFNDERIRYRRNESNIGARNLVRHWNLLLKETDAEFIIIASDDDVYHKDFLKTIDVLQQKYPDADLLRARIQHINENGEVIWKERPFDENQTPIEAICDNPDTCIGNYVFKRKTLINKGGFIDFPYAMGSDTATAMVMSEKGVANTYNIQFSYRLSSEQISYHSRERNIDKEKLKGALDYYQWQVDYIRSVIHDDTLFHQKTLKDFKARIKNVLIGNCRFYYGALSYYSFFKLLKRLKSLDCFNRKLDELGFIVGYLKSTKWYQKN